MKENRLISVIIPVYNVEKYLPRCLDSIINNTYKNLEIICIDDGSTDGSLKILLGYEKKDNRIKIITKKNGGLSSARNAGLEECTGEFVAFVDSDDWVHKEYFSVLINIQRKKDYDVVVCAYERTKDVACMERSLSLENKVRELDRNSYMMSHETKKQVWGRIYKKSSIQGILFDEEIKMEDVVYNITFALNNPNLKGGYVDLAIYAYYIRENSLISFFRTCDILQVAQQYYKCTDGENEEAVKEVLYKESLKNCLYARYIYRLEKNKEGERQCNILLKNCLKKISSEKWKFAVPVYAPPLYRLRCIIKDSSMIQFEKNVKKRRRKISKG